jgi:cobalt-zinc-cadmium efflux system outer membrane protein
MRFVVSDGIARSLRSGMGGRSFAAWARALAVGVIGVGGCAHPPVAESDPQAVLPHALDRRTAANDRDGKQAARPKVIPAAQAEPAVLPVQPGLDDLVALAVARNPRLAKATFAIDAARGRHIQAGLYPNPDLALNWDEIGDRTGHGGIVTLPKLSQTLVTGRKLSLAQAVAATEIDQATLALMGER